MADFSQVGGNVIYSPSQMQELYKAISLELHYIERSVSVWLELLNTFIDKITRVPRPMHTSKLSGSDWVDELLNGHPVRCFNAVRMNKDSFMHLLYLLEKKYYINDNAQIPSKVRLALFLRTLSHRCANRTNAERFQHSGSSISLHFHDILEAIGRLGKDIVRPRDPTIQNTPSQITNNTMYSPLFKDFVGAIDGCHVELTPPEKDGIRFINRKGVASTNVLAICDFDLLFIFVIGGWEGSTHDTKVYLNSLNDQSLDYPHPPPGKYFLGHKGYPNRDGLMTPHNSVKYHQAEFRVDAPSGNKELFNRAHSSLRFAIERSFGVLKARWQILLKVPSYELVTQVKIINACFVLHNLLRLSSFGDPCFNLMDFFPNFVPRPQEEEDLSSNIASLRAENSSGDFGARSVVTLKDRLTQELGQRRVRRRVS